MLAAAGVSPRVAMELMRHSDMKLTMGVYTDVAQLPVIEESARLPSLQIPAVTTADSPSPVLHDAAGDAAGDASAGVFPGQAQSPTDAASQLKLISKPLNNGAL